ncbi:MAG TPA: DUF502 domain-containing protein [Planctomycetota bacterium]|nr:DUF502 domain-containing protein [Planctomycetota bacterium]
MSKPQAPAAKPRRRIARLLLTGVAVLLPLFLTGYVVVILCRFVDDMLGRWLGRQLAALLGVPATNVAARAVGAILAVVGAVVVAGLVGALVASFVGRRLLAALQRLLLNVPLVRFIYPSVKQITDFFFGEKRPAFHSVVAVPYPLKGSYVIGFVTGQGVRSLNAATGGELVQVLIPCAPAPISGYVVFVPRRDVIELPITVEEALRFYVSCGVIVPPNETVGAAQAASVQGGRDVEGTQGTKVT